MKSMRAIPARVAALALFVALSEHASAEPPAARDPVTAEALYRSGREAAERGEHDLACEKFQASMALNARPTTLINLAGCSERRGALVQALAQLKQAQVLVAQESLDPQHRRQLDDLVRRELAALEPRLPKLRIVVKDPPPGLLVERDGKALLPAMMGEPLPVDPGKHVVRATAPGRVEERREVELAERESVDVEIALAVVPAVAAPPAPAPAPPPPPEDTGGGVPVWAWIAGGAGLALVGAAVAFEIDSLAAERTIEEQCGEERLCDPGGGYDPADDNARKNRGFALFVGLGAAGVVGIGVGVVGIVMGLASGEAQAPAEQARATRSWRIEPLGAAGAWGGSVALGF
jgi:hypothetical protein